MTAVDPMEDMLQRLNPQQREAVLDDSPATLVNASVGSGKTTVLISKVLYLYSVKNVPLREMVVLTFTNKAANEIRERMRAADPALSDADMPFFGTFHGVALRLLQTVLPVQTLGYTPGFTIIDPDELLEMASGLMSEHALDIKYVNSLSGRLEAYRAGKPLYGNMKKPDDIERLWNLVRTRKLVMNQMDFDDLIANVSRLAEPRLFAPRWILVDEFQDSDEKLTAFIEALRTPDTRLFAVGDPNQIIYSWRGSRQDIFKDFVRTNRAREISLPVNYRSTATILSAAKCFLNDRSALVGIRDTGSRIAVRRHYDPFNEAEYLAGRIARLRAEGVGYREIAVLYRLQRQTVVLGNVFTQAGIPYEVSMRRTLKDVPVLLWTMRLLRAATNRNDSGSLVAVLRDPSFGDGLTPRAARALAEGRPGEPRSELMERIRGFAAWGSGRMDADGVYGYLDLDSRLQPTSSGYAANRELVDGLLEKLDAYLKNKGLPLVEGTASFLNAVALHGIDVVNEDAHTDRDAVQLMTLHACKGLEFRQVFIIGANQGLIPLGSCKTPEEEAEEKRLFFVGITRAKDSLEISYCTSPEDARVLPEPSGYLAMIPARLTSREDGGGAGEGGAPAAVDMRSLRWEVRERIAAGGEPEVASAAAAEPPAPEDRPTRRVRHGKYGVGVVVAEDEDTVTVAFEGYGEKSFSKTFLQLEEV